MSHENLTSIVRVLLGSAAAFSAMAQLTMRIYWTNHHRDPRDPIWHRERAGAYSTFLVFIGIAGVQVTRPLAPLTPSTYLIVAGILSSIYANFTIYFAMRDTKHGSSDAE